MQTGGVSPSRTLASFRGSACHFGANLLRHDSISSASLPVVLHFYPSLPFDKAMECSIARYSRDSEITINHHGTATCEQSRECGTLYTFRLALNVWAVLGHGNGRRRDHTGPPPQFVQICQMHITKSRAGKCNRRAQQAQQQAHSRKRKECYTTLHPICTYQVTRALSR